MANTPRLGINMMATNDLQKEVVFNEAIIAFDALVARSVINRQNSPPGSPVDGATYIVGALPSGAWTGHANEIAFWYNGWRYILPTNKMKFFNETTSTFWTYTTGVWAADASGTPTFLDDLANVSASAPANGDMLAWNSSTSRWEAGPPNFAGVLSALGDVDAADPDNGDVLIWNEGLEKWQAVEAVFGATQLGHLNDVDMSGASNNDVFTWNSSTGKAEWKVPAASTYNVLTALLDVNLDGAVANDALVYNGAVWAPSSVVFNFSFLNMMDGPGTMVGHAGHFMVVDETESILQYMSLGDLLGVADFHMQDLSDMPDSITDADIGKFVQLYKDGSEYKFQYTTVNYAIPFFNGPDQLTTRVTRFTFNGFNVTEPVEGQIVVTNANPIEYRASGVPVDGLPISAINFNGAGVGVTNTEGVLQVEITNAGGALESLSDTEITDPTDGQALVFDAISGKWVNGEGFSSIPEIEGIAEAALYELGPFAPPTAAMFPLRFNAASADITQVKNRGLMFQPGPQSTGPRHSALMRQLSNNTAPWQFTARVVPNGRAGGFAGGIMMQRSANNSLVFLNIGESSSDTQTLIRFGSVNAAGTETIAQSASTEYLWLRLAYDGNIIRGYISNDGLIWNSYGSLTAATVLGGPPDRIGIECRTNTAHAGDVGVLVTYYEDPDFPAAVRTTQGVVTLGLNGLSDVDLESTPPTPGQTIVWNNVSEQWEPGDATGVGYLADLLDVDFTTPPEDGQTIVWDDDDGKWVPGVATGGGGGPSDVDLSWFIPGVPDGDEIIARHLVTRSLILDAGLIDSLAIADTASTGTVLLSIKKNGVQFATLEFNSSDTGVFTMVDPVTFVPGDILDITSPVSLQGLADVAITIAGRR